MNFKVVPIPFEIATETRETLLSPQYKSLRADVSLATGYGPCRSCLRVFKQSEEDRIYLTYNSFDGLSTLPDPGPIFIHRETCERYEDASFPPDLLEVPILLEGYGTESRLIRRNRMEADSVKDQIGQIFADSEVRFINLRNAEAGCFVARVERTNL
ncbi:MAG: DUF1203 domain-containing protein [Blastocatellia bacterium]